MSWSLPALMDLLGVDRILAAYETQPWYAEDAEKGLSCSANAIMDADMVQAEADIYLVREHPGPEEAATEEIFKMLIKPRQDGQWVAAELRIKGQSFVGKLYNWEEKGCNLFRAVTVALARGEIPNFDELIEREMHDRERFADQYGGSSNKAPKIRPDQLMEMGGAKGF